MKKILVLFFFGFALHSNTAFAQSTDTDSYLTGEQCAAKGGTVENFGYCSDSDVNKNVGKMVGLPGRICCVNISVRVTTPVTKSDCKSKGGSCLVPAADWGGLQCPATRKPLGICSDDAADKAVCCGELGTAEPLKGDSDSTTSADTAAPLGGNVKYKLLEPIPGQEGSGSSLPQYLKAILNAALVIIVLSAVFMVSVGGFMYLASAGNTSKASQAKGIITDALFGLILALIAYLILFIINPDLVTLRISQLSTSTPEHLSTDNAIPASKSPTGAGVPATGSSGDVYTNDEAVAALSAAGISVTSHGSCSDQKNASCTSLKDIPKSTVANIIAIKKTGCSFNVTGGTETGHKSHGSGLPVVDLSKASCLNTLFTEQKSSLSSNFNITKICADQSSRAAALGCSYIEPAPHFHVQFSL